MIAYRARWVHPISAPPIEDGVVVVDGERIAWVGPAAAAPEAATRDLGDALLLPGLVNAHTHLELTAMRGFLEELPFRRWLLTLTSAKRQALSRDDMLDAARLGVVEGLRAGITTYADTCDSGVALDAMLELGVRGVMYQEHFGPDPRMIPESMDRLRGQLAAYRPRETSLVRVGVSPHAPYSVCSPLYEESARFALAERLPMAVHIAESEDETRLVRDGEGEFADALRTRGIVVEPRGRSPMEMLERTGVLARSPLLIHGVRMDADDVALARRHDCGVAHCPASNAKLGHGVAPLLEWLDAGLRVGLGSDSMASNNVMDMLGEARVAALAQGIRRRAHDALGAGRALELATLGGARALGMERTIGTLEPGKAADLAAFPLDRPHTLPHFEPAGAAVWALPGTPARLVTVAGRELVRDGRVLGEVPGLATRVGAIADRLARWRRSAAVT